MGELLTLRSQLAFEEEAAVGTAETLDVNDVKAEVFELAVNDNFDLFERLPHDISLGQKPAIIGKRQRDISFEVDARGSGAVGTAPEWAQLVKACGFQELSVESGTISGISGTFQHLETITGGTSTETAIIIGDVSANGTIYVHTVSGTFQNEVITGGTSSATATLGADFTASQGFLYLPISTGFTALTMSALQDGFEKRARGCRGTFVLRHVVGEPVRFVFNFSGVEDNSGDRSLFASPTYDTTIPVAYLDADPIFASGFNPCFQTLELDIGNTIAMRPCPTNTEGILAALITQRNPIGSMDMEAELAATTDLYADWKASTTRYFEETFGTVAGNQIRVIAPAMQIGAINQEDRDGILLMSSDVRLAKENGDDELAIMMF